MKIKRINGIDIAYETIGSPGSRPLVMIMGLVSQLIAWPDEFCQMLADNGHYVIRFDNRDVGLSSKLEHLGTPHIDTLMADLSSGKSITIPYSLEDMAGDIWGLMDALDIASAHICGISMGGMIAQVMAINKPARVLSMTCLETSTGELDLPPSTPEAIQAMMSAAPISRDAYVDYSENVYRAFSNNSELLDTDLQRRISAAAYDRMFYPIGFTRQMAAIIAAPGRRKALYDVEVPTLVIHGDCDTVVPLEHGKDIAMAVPNAKLLVIKGLGHGMAFPSLWQKMVNAIAKHTKNA